MADLMQTYNFPDVIEGNSFYQIEFQLPEAEVYNLAGAKVFMQVRKKPGQIVAAEFSTVNGKLIVVNNYRLKFPAQIITIPADSYYYDILFIYPDGRRRTLIGGKWTIQSITTKKAI